PRRRRRLLRRQRRAARRVGARASGAAHRHPRREPRAHRRAAHRLLRRAQRLRHLDPRRRTDRALRARQDPRRLARSRSRALDLSPPRRRPAAPDPLARPAPAPAHHHRPRRSPRRRLPLPPRAARRARPRGRALGRRHRLRDRGQGPPAAKADGVDRARMRPASLRPIEGGQRAQRGPVVRRAVAHPPLARPHAGTCKSYIRPGALRSPLGSGVPRIWVPNPAESAVSPPALLLYWRGAMVPLIVFSGLLGFAILCVLISAGVSGLKHRMQNKRLQNAKRKLLIHSINDDRCTGCEACITVCPTDVLELQGPKSRVARMGDCIQCEQCVSACPTTALVMHYEGTKAPPIRMPQLDDCYQAVPGLYLIGEAAGKPLVKNASNLGRAVVEHMLKAGLRPNAYGNGQVDVLIIGSGPGGLSAALSCVQHGLSYALIEKDELVAATI